MNAALNPLHDPLHDFFLPPFNNNRWHLTSGGLILNASAIFPYSSLTLANPSILPVGLPCASCVWKTSLGRRLAGGGGSPAPFTADLLKLPTPACPPLTSSFSTKCSFVDLFFFLHGPNGIFLFVLFCLVVFHRVKTQKSPSHCYNIEVPVEFQAQRSCCPYLLPSFLLAFLSLFLPSASTFPFLTCPPQPRFDFVLRQRLGGVNIQQVGGECGINSVTTPGGWSAANNSFSVCLSLERAAGRRRSGMDPGLHRAGGSVPVHLYSAAGGPAP